jgi:hypothetical protein
MACSNDGTCKVWDFISLHNSIQQYTSPYDDENGTIVNTVAGGSYAAASHVPQSYIQPHHQSPQVGHHFHNEEHSVADSYVHHNMMNPRSIARAFPPRCVATYFLPAKVYSYCGVFQEVIPTSNTDPFGGTNGSNLFNGLNTSVMQPMEYNSWRDQMLALQSSLIPRVIIGNSDGRIRVFDHDPNTGQTALAGYIGVVDKDEHGKVIEYPPHNGTVNSVVIDERSR